MSCPHFIPAMCRRCGETNCGGDPSKCALNAKTGGGKSFREMLDIYRLTAMERHQRGRISKQAAGEKITTINRYLRTMELKDTDSCSITKANLQEYYDRLITNGVSASAAFAQIEKIRGFFSVWMRDKCEELGITVEPPKMPRDIDRGSTRKKVADDERTAIKLWYQNLIINRNKSLRIFALMMRKYAMRPNDVARLKWSDMDGGILKYMPHKTSTSSKRTVEIKMAATDIEEIRRYREWMRQPRRGGGKSIDRSVYVFGGGSCNSIRKELNRSIKQETGHRLYILRALCITEHYVRAGAAAAKAVSGDNKIRTLDEHYIFENAVKVAAFED